MMECSNCETAQFLQITESRIAVVDGGRDVSSVREFYICTLCGGTGELVFDADDGAEAITGTVRLADEMEVRV